MIYNIICKRLKELREENELSQEYVANVLGVSRVVYNRYENGNRTIPIEYLVKLADFYKISLDYIAGRID